MIRQTSLKAYRELKPQAVSARHKEILWYIRRFPDCTDRELARLMRYGDPNKVRPRRKELLDAGRIRESGRKKCSVSGKTALTWRVCDE